MVSTTNSSRIYATPHFGNLITGTQTKNTHKKAPNLYTERLRHRFAWFIDISAFEPFWSIRCISLTLHGFEACLSIKNV
ncbi:MAG: hypothetical protein ACYTXC_19305 [Nostoc sp.]